MFSEKQICWLFSAVAICGAAWWLVRKSQVTKQRRRVPNWSSEKRRAQPFEYSLDDTIEASFPASDPPASTPLLGTGRRQ